MPRRFIQGLKRFQTEHFPLFREHYEQLVAAGQSPSTLFIGCSDSRVDPNTLMGTAPGELFIVRNVGAFVPPFEADEGYHGVSAAIEFAVVILGVSDVVVCGHSHCGAIGSLYNPPNEATPHINRWLELGMEARAEGEVTEELLRRTEQRSIALQLSRLMTFPMVSERVASGRLALHGWHYIIERGEVLILDVKKEKFVPAQ